MRKPIRTLVVDDEADIRRLYEEILGMASDFEIVGTASNGLEAVAAAANHAPELVLLDVMMPVVDGITAASAVRAVAPNARIVFVTALEKRILNAERIRQAQPDAVLLKTLSPSALLDELRQVMVTK